jgi:hypothetical protein
MLHQIDQQIADHAGDRARGRVEELDIGARSRAEQTGDGILGAKSFSGGG